MRPSRGQQTTEGGASKAPTVLGVPASNTLAVGGKSVLPSAKFGVQLLLVLVLVTQAIDAWLPIAGVVSFALFATSVALTLPWLIFLLRPGQRKHKAEPPAPLWSLILRLGLAALTLAFLFAKWQVLVHSGGTDQAFAGSSRSYSLALAVLMALGLLLRGLRVTRVAKLIAEHPARLMALSFGGAGFVGALLLSMPISVVDVSRVSLVDNLFTAFSAVCVTGLTVNSVPLTYTLVGQGVLCLLIQIGGLGIMVLSAAIALLVGQRLRVRSTVLLSEMVDGSSIASLRRTVLMICVYTLTLEGIGALLLYSQFALHPEIYLQTDYAQKSGGVLWACIFHAVSAFCNAGFSNFTLGLVSFSGQPVVLLVVTTLIVFGGIGFPVLDELFKALLAKLRRRRLEVFSLHTRVALAVSGGLLGLMTLVYLVTEWTRSFAGLSYVDRFSVALFQSASSRTAGFNAVDMAAMQPATLVLTCAAMFIGASPGSTGGGIKTTTFAALCAGLRSELTGKAPHLMNRRLPDRVIRKAIGVSFLSLAFVLLAFVLLLLVETHPPLDLIFEVISAFTTTGLSTGITPNLTVFGKLLITLMMFVGRVGPLTLALALAIKPEPTSVELPEEKVLIG